MTGVCGTNASGAQAASEREFDEAVWERVMETRGPLGQSVVGCLA